VITIGVISDTHGTLDRKVGELFAGVDHILHAGDIGNDSVLHGLERIAPVTAVEGNCDCNLELGETKMLVLGGLRFVLRHIFDARSPGGEMRKLLHREKPHVIIFGHTHVPCIERWGDMILFNPGYAGRQRFKLPRSVGIIRCDELGISAQHLDL
jgi:putative phosphoesterase